MTQNPQVEEALAIISTLILKRDTSTSMTHEDIIRLVERVKPMYSFNQEETEQLIKRVETLYSTTMGTGVSLIDTNIPHNDDWYGERTIGWDYWKDYEALLSAQGWSTRVISSMDAVTNKILGLLHDPLEDGDWERRGLVIGHVQSGKTANYIGLITKAADAGYKFIIVIAGIHNSLRTQTQERVDYGFIGRDSKTHQPIGASIVRPKRDMPVTVTTTESDFNRTLAKAFGMELKSLNNTFILVIKKNASTLSNLYTWLRELNTQTNLEKISDIPMLLIDDEADNASINTNKLDLDPTRINKEIRNILNLFRKRCYVGYTATPFANIFIDPDDKNETQGNNLFPEHFIYCLDAPTNYFGSEKIFLDEEANEGFIRKIDDAEEFIPLKHKKDQEINELPLTLKKAIRVFILSRAIRNLRGQRKQHSSMMINISRLVSTQRQVQQLVAIYLDRLKKAIRYNYRLSANRATIDSFIAQLLEDFNDEYSNSGLTWQEVLLELNDAAEFTKVFLINSNSDERLDYSAYSKEGNALTAIAIGGLSLSRGLTIEGLTVSYVYRNSKMYDTLMQMGRWFGYRDNYEDLCRIYMSEESSGWYAHIAEATEELRLQVKRMRREGKKPSDFGLYVKAHPDTLIVTALNKMYHTENRAFEVSYDGKLLETHIIPAVQRKNDDNRKLFLSFHEQLRRKYETEHDETQSFVFFNVPWQSIQGFILSFNFHSDLLDLKEIIPHFIKEISDLSPQWDVSFKSLSDKQPSPGQLIVEQERNIGHDSNKNPRVPSSESGWYVGNKQKVSGNSMFHIGLSSEQKQKAQKFADESGRKDPIYRDYTNARGKPLLMLHLLNLVDKEKDSQLIAASVPALSISFPNSVEFRTVNYVVGKVWLKQFEQNQFDSATEEDDYDL